MKPFALSLILAAMAFLLIGAPDAAFAGKGGNVTAVTIEFDDLLGDAIQSDGLGAYDGVMSNRDGSLTVETGDRGLYMDLGSPDGLQLITNLTITVSSLDGATATAEFETGTRDGAFAVIMTVSVHQSGGTYHLASASEAEMWSAYRQRVTGRGSSTGPLVWAFFGFFDMPWGAEVSP